MCDWVQIYGHPRDHVINDNGWEKTGGDYGESYCSFLVVVGVFIPIFVDR